MDFNEVMPFILFWIPWLMAVNELCNHFRHGFMHEYLRRSSEDDEPATRTTTLARHPISYRLLLLLYSATAVAVPVVTVFVLYNRQAG